MKNFKHDLVIIPAILSLFFFGDVVADGKPDEPKQVIVMNTDTEPVPVAVQGTLKVDVQTQTSVDINSIPEVIIDDSIPLNVNITNFPTGSAADQPTILLRVSGQTQGEIAGDSDQSVCVDCIEVYGFSHEIISPLEAESGLPTGRRQHKPIILIKEIDRSTPLLAQAFYNNENLFDVEFIFINNDGMPYYTIELINASIADIRSAQNLENEGPPKERISLTYQSIIQTWVEEDISAEDDWLTPTA